MKGLITAICLAAAIAAGSFWYMHEVSEISDNLLQMDKTITDSLNTEQYNDAVEEIRRLDDYIDKKRTLLSATGNHEQLDKIEMNIKELSGYAEGGGKNDAISLCRVLSVMFEQLPRDYKITLENIL